MISTIILELFTDKIMIIFLIVLTAFILGMVYSWLNQEDYNDPDDWSDSDNF